jgi:NAD(P)-dependent dehydrogenase (short-subunit alcohol dehydrogenase family)
MAAGPKLLSDQVIVVTGALGAVGLCTARMAVQAGAKLVLVFRAGHGSGSIPLPGLAAGANVLHLQANVCSREELCVAADAAVRHFGCIDTWINNACMSIYGRFDEVGEDDSRRLFDVNFWSAVNGSLAALPHLSMSGGSLINVGSEVECTASTQGMYLSSKQAVTAFTKSLRREVRRTHGKAVTISLIEPAATMGEGACDPVRVAQAILLAAETGGVAEVGARWFDPPCVRRRPPWAGDPSLPLDPDSVPLPAGL